MADQKSNDASASLLSSSHVESQTGAKRVWVSGALGPEMMDQLRELCGDIRHASTLEELRKLAEGRADLLVVFSPVLVNPCDDAGAFRFIVRGTLRLDLRRRCAIVQGQEFVLTPRESDILAYLMDAAPRIVSVSELIAKVFRASHRADTSTVKNRIADLRRALGPYRWAVRAVRGKGYVLDASSIGMSDPDVLNPA